MIFNLTPKASGMKFCSYHMATILKTTPLLLLVIFLLKAGNVFGQSPPTSFVHTGPPGAIIGTSPANLSATGSITFEAWIKLPTTVVADPNVWTNIVHLGNGPAFDAQNPRYLSIFYNNATGGFLHNVTNDLSVGAIQTYTNASPIPINTWFHYALVVTPTARLVFINGTLIATTSNPPTFTTISLPPTGTPLNASFSLSYPDSPAMLSEVRIWNVARSQFQIFSTMNCQISPQPSLAMYYGGPIISPTINIAVTGGTNPTCSGTSVTFTAAAIDTGSNPIYQWQKDGATVGTGTTYTDSGTTGGNITCSITGGITCATPVAVTSSGINLIVNNPTAPTITCPSAITVVANHVGSTYIGSIGTAQTTANCSASISGPIPAGPYSLGTTVVTWTATASAGQTATCTQNVTVIMPPSITTFSPASGVIGSSVTITGAGFKATAAQNIVFFGATRATVTAASDTSLTVTVPVGATYQFLSVTNLATNVTAYSAVPFNVTLAGSTSFLPKLDFTSGTNPYSVSSGDLDGDGKPDVVVINITTRILSVFRNTSTSGAVSFAPKVDINIVSDARSVSMGDLDGDGKLDLALANWTSSTVSVLRNTSTLGTVTFAPKIDFATGVNPPSVTIGDLDGDGKPELAVANFGSNSVSVFRNTSTLGTLSFGNKIDFSTNVNPYSVSLGDIDGDGKPDLASANQGTNNVSILRNTSTFGLLNFATKVDFAAGTTATSVSIGDLNADGKPDLAVANYNSNTVSIFSNTSTSGSMNFATKVDFPTGANPLAVIIGDIDGNGRPDLVVANFGGTTASVFRNTSNSSVVSFAAKVDITAGSAPISVRLGDIDGDGKPDLTVANYNTNNISVIRQDLPCTLATISCPGNQVANTTANNCAATVSYTAAVTGYPTPSIAYAFTGATTASGSGTGSGSSFNIGVTNVTITVSNSCTQDVICSFTVTVNAPVINLQGNSINIIDGSPTPSTSNFTDFESVSTVSSRTRSFTIQNTGSSSLSITGISFTGTNASEFVVTTAPASSVAAGDSTIFVVRFTPTGSGIRNATIRIANTSCATNVYDFALQGTGFVEGATLSFDGVNDFVSAARPMTVTDNFTLEAWINPSVLSGVRVPVGYGGYISRFAQYNGCAIALNGSSLQFFIGGSYIATGYTFPAANQWYHVAFVRNSGTIRAYVNGVQTPSTSTQTVTTPTNFGIGCLNSPTGQFFNFNGRIDEVRLWDIVRTQAQIQAFMNCEIQVATPGLKANYQFNQGLASATNTAVTSLSDASGNSITGTLTNFGLSGATSNWIAPGAVGSGNSCTPIITAFNPGSACVNTTPVVITGAGFTGATAVSFGGTPALSFTVNTANQITAIPSGGTTGTISVTSPNGSGVSASTFTVNSIVTPTFAAITPICSGTNMNALPTTSTNGITGTWSPALNNTTTTVYTFTPTAGLCATTTTMTIVVNPNVTPTFAAITPICSGTNMNALPTTSNNGITGTWSPALNSTTTTVYTFTPTAGLCATTTTMTIVVNPNVTPTFVAVAPICSGTSMNALPTTSTNGITGTWSPALDNTTTTVYTFAPTAGLCATTTTMTIVVNPNVTPTFAAIASICSGTSMSALPITSTNGITGTWSPAIDNTTTTVYTFTPTAGLCATTTTMTVIVNPNVTPTFAAITPICSGTSMSALPITSTNGINGTWSPAINNTTTTVYTFTPTAGLCATATTLQIEVIPNIPFYADADGDGYAFYDAITAGDPTYFCLGATIPSGYFAAANFIGYDCDDINVSIYQFATFFIDGDGDGYDGGSASVCSGITTPIGYAASSLGYDCDDTSSNIYQFATFFIDGDGDGYDGGSASVCSGTTTPIGYATSSFGSDCEDLDASVWRLGNFFSDSDGDGFGFPISYSYCYGLTTPTNASTNDTDCSDEDPSVYQLTTFYIDSDGDSYTVGNGILGCFGVNPPVGATFTQSGTEDCNDTNNAIFIGASVWIDADEDGYALHDPFAEYGPTYLCYGGSIPPGYLALDSFIGYDCDDSNNTIFIGTSVWIDADGDGYALNDPNTEGTSTYICNDGTVPPGYLTSENFIGYDCDDSNAAIYKGTSVWIDADDDGYALYDPLTEFFPELLCHGATIPTGYIEYNSSLGFDCNDSNSAIFFGTKGWIDADGDGYALNDPLTEGGPTYFCQGASGYLSLENFTGYDCDDTDQSIYQSTWLYTDGDADTYTIGTGSNVCYGAALPNGYALIQSVTNDCDDSNNTIFFSGRLWIDADGDGYAYYIPGEGYINTCLGATIPPGFLDGDNFLGYDCDDTNNAIYQLSYLYTDADADTYTIGTGSTVCYGAGAALPNGYALIPSATNDCDDNNNTILGGGTLVFIDADGDGYAFYDPLAYSNTIYLCFGGTIPPGYVAADNLIGFDCDDTNSAIYRTPYLYIDADGDGYAFYDSGSFGSGTDSVCVGGTIPPGYVAADNFIGFDCDDSNNNILGAGTYVYVDADGDGYAFYNPLHGFNSIYLCFAGAIPPGYVSAVNFIGFDCDDSNNAIYQLSYLYTDADADTYTIGIGSNVCSGAALLNGYALIQSATNDCDDNNNTILGGGISVFIDADGDGYAVYDPLTYGGPIFLCFVETIPPGYVAADNFIGFDCDDSNNAIYQSPYVFIDADGDGYALNDNTYYYVCIGATIPTGYIEYNNFIGFDCDDANGATYRTPYLFIDADGDGYASSVSGTNSLCIGATIPSGYIAPINFIGFDCNDTNALLNPTNPCPTNSIVNLTLFIEGFYDSSVSLMRSRLLNGWNGVTPSTAPSALDVEVLTVRLHDAVTYAEMFSTTATLGTDGTLSASFAGAPSGSFYIAVKGSNMVETWSADALSVGTTPLSYNFSSAAAQAYGANMIEVVPGVFAFYSGDFNQDGNVDPVDFGQWEIDYNDFAFGYFATDLTGDGNVDPADFGPWEVNYNNFISILRP